jgi:hypothetical protein
MCNPFFDEYQVDPSVNVFKIIYCTASTYSSAKCATASFDEYQVDPSVNVFKIIYCTATTYSTLLQVVFTKVEIIKMYLAITLQDYAN